MVFYRKDWARIIRALVGVARTRRVETSTERLAMLLIVATIPVGLTGLALERTFRTLFAKPLAAAVFLTLNGLILLAGERLRRRSERQATAAALPGGPGAALATDTRTAGAANRKLETLSHREAGVIGLFQTLALFAGISRSGITMVGGLLRGLDHEDAAKFSFLLATPVILAAGVLKLPSLAGPAGAHIHGQVIVGLCTAAVAAYVAVRFPSRWFTTRTLTPFAVYCLLAGAASAVHFA
ncbi:undecaprenyl-diphosphate phosphatase [Streptomyces sp. NPDC007901]|uniref:undecaprenyl-diphosphate phosphatase n=1 Tax=Streptomyces sp. NPDC007901 TaxID=3364785 RepID=UPI0036EC3D5C